MNMALMTTEMADVQRRNKESSILFIQQEHAKTLQGLHGEIHHLQKRVSDLTFQLAMNATSSSQEEENAAKISCLEAELTDTKKQLAEKEAALEKRDRKIGILEQQLKAQEKKFADDARSHRILISQLHGELESKANTIARLTTQIHTFKIKARETVGASSDIRTSSSNSLEEGESRHMTPVPPKEGAPRHRRRLSGRLSLDGQILPSPMNIRHHTSQKINSVPDSNDYVPDPTPFLNRPDSTSRFHKAEKTVLPPIGNRPSSRSSNTSSPSPGVDVFVPQKTQSYTFKQKRGGERTPSSSPEVEVLAVGQVVQRNHSLRRAHEYNSTD